MGYLVLARHQGERLYLSIKEGADEAALLDDLRSGGIYIDVVELNDRTARIGIDAPRELLVLREELLPP